MDLDLIKLARLHRETITALEIHAKRVDENKGVEAALEFARYVFWSGMLELMEAHPHPFPLVVDGKLIRGKLRLLQDACLERFRTNDKEPTISQLQLKSINEKLDMLLCQQRGQNGVHDNNGERQRLVTDSRAMGYQDT